MRAVGSGSPPDGSHESRGKSITYPFTSAATPWTLEYRLVPTEACHFSALLLFTLVFYFFLPQRYGYS